MYEAKATPTATVWLLLPTCADWRFEALILLWAVRFGWEGDYDNEREIYLHRGPGFDRIVGWDGDVRAPDEQNQIRANGNVLDEFEHVEFKYEELGRCIREEGG